VPKSVAENVPDAREKQAEDYGKRGGCGTRKGGFCEWEEGDYPHTREGSSGGACNTQGDEPRLIQLKTTRGQYSQKLSKTEECRREGPGTYSNHRYNQ